MARIKLLALAIIALGLASWGLMSVAGATAPDQDSMEAQLSAAQTGIEKAVDAQASGERAAAFQVLSSAEVATALAGAKSDGPAIADAPALKTAVEKALQAVPGNKPAWVAAAMSTASGAVAVVPGHDPLSASQFSWISDALAAGPRGQAADVAGKHVKVFASTLRAMKGDEVTELGTVAIAFSREPSDLGGLLEAGGWKSAVVVDKKAIASSPKDLADVAAAATSSTTTLKAGTVEALGPIKLPMGGSEARWPLVKGRSFNLTDYPGASVVVLADLRAKAAAAAAAQKNGVFSLAGILLIGLVFVAIGGGAAAPAEDEEPMPAPRSPRAAADRMEPSLAPPPAPAAEPAGAPAMPVQAAPPPTPPTPPPPPADLVAEAPSARAHEPVTPPPAAVEPEPLFAESPPPENLAESEMVSASALMSESADPPSPQVPGFDELFGPAPDAQPPPRRMPATDPLAFLAGAGSSANAGEERTSTMSLAEVQGLAAKAAQPAAEFPRASEEATRVVPAPTAPDPFASAMMSGGEEPIQDRTVVAMVPQELLRAATRAVPQGRPSSNPIGLAGLSAEEIHFQDVYREFCITRERCGEPADNLTFEKFAAKLRKNKEALVAKYACKSVRFQVYVKEGKAALKATPVKEL